MAEMDGVTDTLFGDDDAGSSIPRTRQLKIAASPRQKLTSNQRAFNRLSKQVETLQEQIRKDTARLDAILRAYGQKIPGLKRELADAQINMARALADSTRAAKYGKRQIELVREAILALCDDAFSVVEPDEPTQRFFKEWTRIDYQEEIQNQKQSMEQMMADMARETFGLDIDFSQMGDTPEEMAQFASRLNSQINEHTEASHRRGPRWKKSRKQLEQEQRQREEEERKVKTVRGLYLSLAKALHPDTETDPGRKAQKEELMRRVTAAYAGKDLSALLKLELEWVADQQHDLASLSEEKLGVYVSSLKEQVDQLKHERMMAISHPRYEPISQWAHLPESLACRQISDMEHACVRWRAELADAMRACLDRHRKAEVIEFMKRYVDSARAMSEDPWDDMMDIVDLLNRR